MCMTGAQNKETTSSDDAHGRRAATACSSGRCKLPITPHKLCQPFETSADPQRQSGVICIPGGAGMTPTLCEPPATLATDTDRLSETTSPSDGPLSLGGGPK